MTARDNARLERQRKLAEVLRTQAEAEDRGEDVERQKNWEWTIEENDNWEKKKARKARRADYEFHGRGLCHSLHDDIHLSCVDDVHAARRRYKKDLDLIKPDLVAYNRQKEAVLGLAPGSLSKSGSSTPSSSALTTFDPSGGQASVAEPFICIVCLMIYMSQVVPSPEQRMAAESFYRDANTLLYADNKPTEDAIDRVVGKINREYAAVHFGFTCSTDIAP
jgi:pre-mRNA-splicing factor SYF2